jgi:hypothetical protein
MSQKTNPRIASILYRALLAIGLAAGLVLSSTEAQPAYTQDLAGVSADYVLYLPMILSDYPYVPPNSEVYVENNTGSQLCYTVENTGIGQKCFPAGTHFYGAFPPGIYTWYASASCGSGSGSEHYESGIFTHTFWCE